MGDKTFESIGNPLPKRTNIIITRNKNYRAKGCKITYSIKDAINLGKEIDKEEIFIIGGGSIYKQTIDLADKLYLTIVDDSPKADTYFPDYSQFKNIIYKKKIEDKGLKFKFLELTK
jgi:dihydrofolate reductase